MWKDFFYFNKGERRAILALTILIIIIQLFIWTSDFWLTILPESITDESNIQKDMDAFQDSSTSIYDSNISSYGSSRFSQYSGRKDLFFPKSTVELSKFNPNIVDSARFVSMGLPPFIVRNILKYRRMGGVFRKVEDFARIYGLEPEQYARLKPYIQLPTSKIDFTGEPFTQDPERTEKIGKLTVNHEAFPDKLIIQHIDINTVDTTVLQQIKGVGSVTAKRIAKYRDRLGGFYSMHQLEDIKGIYPEALTRLQSLLKVDTSQIERINVNKASLEKLRSHPYLSYYQAKVIVELRRARSGIKNIKELSEFKEFTVDDMERLKWYLSF